ncbi:hypothetical protein [Virgibacillus senegalensis]|uniref:hypothetical protein n=1 Tax=Virgibacillus senegalensis TaxID=1499679 RepID=UPI00069D2A22|nr:hypothetical protein [Virgibacillus senegalensis]
MDEDKSMDPRIKLLVDETKRKFGLEDYYLERYQLSRDVNLCKNTVYMITMEWFPFPVSTAYEDELNPEGTAVIEMVIDQHVYSSAIFVGGKSYAKKGIVFSEESRDAIIHWVEKESGLKYGKQFFLERASRSEYLFKACVQGTIVSPGGRIKLELDSEGNLIFFSVSGDFPTNEMVEESSYRLSIENIEQLVKQQIQVVPFPSYEQEKLISIYALEEIYVKNDQDGTLPFPAGYFAGTCLRIDEPILWEKRDNSFPSFYPQEMNWHENITTDQAFSNEPSPDVFPITYEQKVGCMEAVKQVLRQEYPEDSGRWILNTIHREKGKLVATLKSNNQSKSVFSRKLLVFIDADRLFPIQYIDNQTMLEMVASFDVLNMVAVTKEEAFKKLKGHIKLNPAYVYDLREERFVLCGKLDCDYGVSAADGEVIELKDL